MRNSAKTIVLIRQRYDPSEDAVSRSIRELVEELERRGYTCVMQRGRAKMRAFTPLDRVLFYFSAASYIVRHRREIDVVITLEDPTGAGALGYLARLLNSSTAHISWLMDLNHVQQARLDVAATPRKRAALRVRQMIDLWSVKHADRVVVLGTCMREVLHNEGIGRVSVVPIWQNSRELWPEPHDLAGVAKPLIAHVGHAATRHPLSEFHLAAQDLSQSGIATFAVIGSGAEVDRLLRSTQRGPANGLKIRRRKSNESINELLNSVDVHFVSLAAAATGTCVPSKVYAAMAVGRPVVYFGDSEGQAARDIVEADAGIVIEPMNGSMLRNALDSLAKSPSRRAEMGANGLRFFLSSREVSVIAQAWCELIDDVHFHRKPR